MADAALPQAVLLDRDGTIIEDRHYLRDPAEVALLPGAAEAIRLLAARGIPSIVCTNQSGIARGMITLEQYRAVRLRTEELLAAEGATLRDSFACPHHPDFSGPCDCRKPGVGLFERAATLYGLALSRCLFVGDKFRDVSPALGYGARATLVPAPDTSDVDRASARAVGIGEAPSLLALVRDLMGGAA